MLKADLARGESCRCETRQDEAKTENRKPKNFGGSGGNSRWSLRRFVVDKRCALHAECLSGPCILAGRATGGKGAGRQEWVRFGQVGSDERLGLSFSGAGLRQRGMSPSWDPDPEKKI